MSTRGELLAGPFVARSSAQAHLQQLGTRASTQAGPLSIAKIEQHVSGWKRMGAIPFMGDAGEVLWACCDFDMASSTGPGKQAWPRLMDPDSLSAHVLLQRFATALDQRGFVPFIERSKGKGWHVWVFFGERVDAIHVRNALCEAAQAAGVPDTVIAAEDFICPRTDTPRSVGNGTWLPQFGEDGGAATRFHTWNAETEFYEPAPDQDAVIQSIAAKWSLPPIGATAPAPVTSGAKATGKPDAGWIQRELASQGVQLENVTVLHDRLRATCPLHEASEENAQSAVFWIDGNGHCSSTRCGARWGSLREFLSLWRAHLRKQDRAGATNGHDPDPAVARSPISSVESERVEWLWAGHIPLGKITTLDGDPGSAKSLITVDLAARLSTGSDMPDGTSCGVSPSATVLISMEDDDADTIRPRLEVAQADLDRVYTLKTNASGGLLSLPEDVEDVERLLEQTQARLLVLDPIMAVLSGKVDSHRDQDVRRALAILSEIAERRGLAIVLVRHLNKSVSGNPLYRGGGSIGIVGAARAGFMVVADPDEIGTYALLPTKANLSRPARPLRYCVRAVNTELGELPRVEWLGEGNGTTQSYYDASLTSGEERGKMSEAMRLLRTELAGGIEVPVRDLQKAAHAAGIGWRTIESAKSRLGITSTKQTFSGRWVWQLQVKTDQ